MASRQEEKEARRQARLEQEAAEQKLPAYCVFTDATLVALAESRPKSATELVKIQGLGPTKAGKYGEQVLAILALETPG